ncbi:MAG: type II toxin-antitoxin system RelB/DinJ family antitoxin [Eggerthellaceae bacterium]|nr:type II toxin-antitoxin system RelB/DinJ family antitoxin [Eggerthellaceae bacterium]
MADAMVTGRMDAAKKSRGARVLSDAGLTASQAINLMYDRLVNEGSAVFLKEGDAPAADSARWTSAARFVDSLSASRSSRFDHMSKGDIRRERLASRGLM